MAAISNIGRSEGRCSTMAGDNSSGSSVGGTETWRTLMRFGDASA